MTTTKDRITLKLEGGIWHAQHAGPFAAEVRKLFGTDTLPTPYTHVTPYETVRANLARTNPDTEVR